MFENTNDSVTSPGHPIDHDSASDIILTNARERQVQAPRARAKIALPTELRDRNFEPDFHGDQKSESSHVHTDTVHLHRVWNETTRFMETIHREVREGKSVMDWSRYGRWLRFSGILEILEANPQPFPLEVNGKALRAKVEDLLSDCGEKFRTGKADPTYVQSDIAEINRKLDVIAAHVGKFASPTNQTPDVDAATAPALRVIEGGAQ